MVFAVRAAPIAVHMVLSVFKVLSTFVAFRDICWGDDGTPPGCLHVLAQIRKQLAAQKAFAAKWAQKQRFEERVAPTPVFIYFCSLP